MKIIQMGKMTRSIIQKEQYLEGNAIFSTSGMKQFMNQSSNIPTVTHAF
jgi:hypothetical protein